MDMLNNTGVLFNNIHPRFQKRLTFNLDFVYLVTAGRSTLATNATYLRRHNRTGMAEWYRNTRGKKGWFEGKDMIALGDGGRTIANPMLVSRALYEPSTGVFEVYANMYEPIPYDPVRSQRSISKALKKYFGTEGMTITDVQPGHFCKGCHQTRVSFYANLKVRPDAEKASKVRDVIREHAVEPRFRGRNKAGDEVEYAYTELPYDKVSNCQIRKVSYDYRAGVSVRGRTIKGYTWECI